PATGRPRSRSASTFAGSRQRSREAPSRVSSGSQPNRFQLSGGAEGFLDTSGDEFTRADVVLQPGRVGPVKVVAEWLSGHCGYVRIRSPGGHHVPRVRVRSTVMAQPPGACLDPWRAVQSCTAAVVV